ncbi:oxidoreductase 2OG-Fe(II) oxygenase family protein [Rutstroemia sp. NJR-2017a BVV2]|nr:oxidoreductase 2OG-Fe(II) oxygenase family protein [Rutstroemia sp. NJR-2017a BVV2]
MAREKMASQKLFDSYPAFPNDVPIANVEKISLAKLTARDLTEVSRMFSACTELGFFLLDLKNDETGMGLQKDVDVMLGLAKEVFDLPYEEKTVYNQIPPQKLVGFVPRFLKPSRRVDDDLAAGVMKTETGQPDQCEFFSISRDGAYTYCILKVHTEMLGTEPMGENPPVIQESRPQITSYLNHINSIAQLLLACLESQLGLPDGKLSSLQKTNMPSGTVIRMIRYASQDPSARRTALLPHTDYGSITLLTSVLGGIQILHRGSDEQNWRYIKPEPDCLIVNMGDAMVEWTGGVLRSNLHRVTYAPGVQAECTRHSIAYLIRPARDVSMKRIVGGRIPDVEHDEEELDITAAEWEMKKAMALKAGADIAKTRGGRPMKPLSV